MLPKTWFSSEDEVWPALVHAAKFKMFCELRADSIRYEDVVRVKIFEENLGRAIVVCRMEKFLGHSDELHAEAENTYASDKHRIMWLIDKKYDRD